MEVFSLSFSVEVHATRPVSHVLTTVVAITPALYALVALLALVCASTLPTLAHLCVLTHKEIASMLLKNVPETIYMTTTVMYREHRHCHYNISLPCPHQH